MIISNDSYYHFHLYPLSWPMVLLEHSPVYTDKNIGNNVYFVEAV